MEAKINIAEILKDKPQGTKLYDLLRNIDVELDKVHITDVGSYIVCTATNEAGSTRSFGYSKLGTEECWIDGLQILLPSKEMSDWRKFDWKKGDVLVSNDSDSHIIFKGFSKNDYTTFEGKHWISVSKKRHISRLDTQNTQNYHIEDNKELLRLTSILSRNAWVANSILILWRLKNRQSSRMEIYLPLRVACLKEIMFLFSMDMTTKITLVTMLRLIMIQISYIFHMVTIGVIKVMT